MNHDRIATRITNLGYMALDQVQGAFPNLSHDAMIWLLLRVFGLLAPRDLVIERAKQQRPPRCSECWQDAHDGHCFDYQIKENMAALMLELEADGHER